MLSNLTLVMILLNEAKPASRPTRVIRLNMAFYATFSFHLPCGVSLLDPVFLHLRTSSFLYAKMNSLENPHGKNCPALGI